MACCNSGPVQTEPDANSFHPTASIHIFAKDTRHDDRFHIRISIQSPEVGQEPGSPFHRCKFWPSLSPLHLKAFSSAPALAACPTYSCCLTVVW